MKFASRNAVRTVRGKNDCVRTGENQPDRSTRPDDRRSVIDLTRRSAAYAFVMCPQKEKNKRKTTHHFAGVRHVVRVQVLDEHVERSFAFFRKRGRVERGFLAVYHCEHNNNRNTSMEKTFAGSRI